MTWNGHFPTNPPNCSVCWNPELNNLVVYWNYVEQSGCIFVRKCAKRRENKDQWLPPICFSKFLLFQMIEQIPPEWDPHQRLEYLKMSTRTSIADAVGSDRNWATGLLLVKCYDNKMVKSLGWTYSLCRVIFMRLTNKKNTVKF